MKMFRVIELEMEGPESEEPKADYWLCEDCMEKVLDENREGMEIIDRKERELEEETCWNCDLED